HCFRSNPTEQEKTGVLHLPCGSTHSSFVFPSTDNSPCKVCPMQWQLHRDKCYWPSDYMKTWDESQHDCSTRASQLLVIQDKEELVRGQLHMHSTNDHAFHKFH
uniref:C-type lectin domain-containing protein n=1 Tax=Podarcis muralis TaxID=64176 RepID=A0A670IQG9_PODMU